MTNTKKNRILFVHEVIKTLKNSGAVETISRLDDAREFELATKTNRLTLTVRGEADHEHVYSVFATFEKRPSRNCRIILTGTHNSKYNFHNWGEVIGEVISDFEEYVQDGILI